MRRREFLWMTVAAQPGELKTRVSSALRKHLDMLLGPKGEVAAIKGKDAAALNAMSFEVMHGVTGEARYQRAAIELADRVLAEMRTSPVGVLAIKIKEKAEATVLGGGPPALGWYASILGHIYQRSGGRGGDLQFLAGVLDRFAWNPEGWWANTVDVKTGRSPVPLEHQGAVNKNCAMVMACAALGEYVKPLDAKLADSLRGKALKCLHGQIIPAQESDGFWHYGLSGRDPNNKDALGYFMLTTELLIWLRMLAPSFRDAALDRCIRKAEEFAARNIAPITDPYRGGPVSKYATRSTPSHYDLTDDLKRSFQLSVLLTNGKYTDQAEKIMGSALGHFPYGDLGQEGGLCAHASAAILQEFRSELTRG